MPNSFKRNVVIGFGFSLFILLISSIASYISIRNLLRSSSLVDHTHQIIIELDKTQTLLLEAETSQRGYLLTGDVAFTEPVQSNLIDIRNQVIKIKSLTVDNPDQQNNINQLEKIIDARLNVLMEAIRRTTEEEKMGREFLDQGKLYMDEARTLIRQMEDLERGLLKSRIDELNKYSRYTPMLIVIAALLSLLIIGVFYGRIIGDYRERVSLQEELLQKDVEVNQRIEIIQSIADKVAQGNYTARIDDENKDLLGSLAGSLNKMSTSLHYSFTSLAEQEWRQAGMAELSKRMSGEQDIEDLSASILNFIAEYTESNIGTLYLYNEIKNELFFQAGYAFSGDHDKTIQLGEGIVGQSAIEKKILTVDGLTDKDFVVTTIAGDMIPASIVVIPVLYEGVLKAVLELGTLGKYDHNSQKFFTSITEPVGIAINSSQSRRKLQALLEETQSQSEELQAQHSELENINEELRAQSQKLQVSEEELKVQQEELMQANMELEERTTLLEEKNQLIEERNEEIQRKVKELAITTKYKSEFLANMSHELRTPLNSILLLSRLMAENNHENLNAEQIEYAQVIQNSGESLLSLIDEILDLSKIESGKMEMEFQQISIKEITNDLRSLFTPLAREKNLEFDIHIATSTPSRIETDKMRIQQILKNLISNALKFTEKGSVTVNVRKHEADDSMIVFSVKDTGIGIPEDKQRLIFEAFQQADGSTRRQYGGTGLGLSISRELARLLGGQIELSSEPDKGSEFRLIIPLKKPDNAPLTLTQEILGDPSFNEAVKEDIEEETIEKNQSAMLITQDDSPDKMSEVLHRIENVLKNEPRKVLIIEENSVHAKALCYFLENFNIFPAIKKEVDEAIDYLLSKDQSCVILDHGTFGDELYATLEKIKQTNGLELLPIIVFTGKNVSLMQEGRLKQYVNSIVLKTAHSYQRILDEVSLFLHLKQEKRQTVPNESLRKLGRLTEVLKDKKVLIADDDVRNIFSLSKALENHGMSIISATDGREAIEQLKANPSIDIVLMDMMMPIMDGYESMMKIRSMAGFGKLPIIAVTAKAMAGDREKCIRSGASDYITKPVDKDQLLSLLRVWLYDRV